MRQQVRLGDVADVRWGDTSTTKASYRASGFTAFSATGADGLLDHFDYEEPGVVVSAIGAQCGKTWFATGKWSCIKNTMRILPRPGQTDARFLYYACQTKGFFPTKGSAQPFIALGDARSIQMSLPTIEEQRRIADVLGTLDDLIEVNRGLITNLDLTVRTVGAGLVKKSVSNETLPFSEYAQITKGYSYKSSELVEGGDSWLVNLKNVGRNGDFQARGFKPLKAAVKAQHLVDNGTVIVSSTDLTQDRDVIARPVRVRRGNVEGQLVASLDLIVVTPIAPQTPESIFAILDSDDFRNHALGYCNGTTVLHMGARAIPDYEAPQLSPNQIADFTSRVRPLREMADSLSIEVAELESARDELLPLLISGRVQVEEVSA